MNELQIRIKLIFISRTTKQTHQLHWITVKYQTILTTPSSFPLNTYPTKPSTSQQSPPSSFLYWLPKDWLAGKISELILMWYAAPHDWLWNEQKLERLKTLSWCIFCLHSQTGVDENAIGDEFSSERFEVRLLLCLRKVEDSEFILIAEFSKNGIVRDELRLPHGVSLIANTAYSYH